MTTRWSARCSSPGSSPRGLLPGELHLAMDGDGNRSDLARLLRQIYESRLAGAATENSAGSAGEILRSAVFAQRRRLVELRDDGTIGDDAFHRVEEDLDWAELNAEALRRQQ